MLVATVHRARVSRERGAPTARTPQPRLIFFACFLALTAISFAAAQPTDQAQALQDEDPLGDELLEPSLPAATEVKESPNCGYLGDNPCRIWNDWWWWGGLETDSGCDRGLDRRNTCCIIPSPFGGCWVSGCPRCSTDVRERGSVNSVRVDWSYWALKQQRRIADTEPVNWIMSIAGHNAFNNKSDFYLIFPNQYYSMTDQLRLGARVLMLDVHSAWCPLNNWTVKLGHGFAACTERNIAYSLIEIRRWVDRNPGEVIIIEIEDYTDGDGLTWHLNDRLGPRMLHRTDRIPGGWSAADLAADHGDDSQSGRWPTPAEMRRMNRQVIVISDGNWAAGDDHAFVFNTKDYRLQKKVWTSDGTGFHGSYDELCNAVDGDWITSGNQFTELWEDRSLDVAGLISYEDRFIDPLLLAENQAVDAARIAACNVSIIGYDWLHCEAAGQNCLPCCSLEPEYSDLKTDEWTHLRERYSRLVWSWAWREEGKNNEAAVFRSVENWDVPSGMTDYYDPDYDGRVGRWFSVDPDQAHHFACGSPRPADGESWEGQDLIGSWAVTCGTGEWFRGTELCFAEFGDRDLAYSVPVNALQNDALMKALEDARSRCDGTGDLPDWSSSGSDEVWLAYGDQDRGSGRDWDRLDFWSELRPLLADQHPAPEGTMVQFSAVYPINPLLALTGCSQSAIENGSRWDYGNGDVATGGSEVSIRTCSIVVAGIELDYPCEVRVRSTHDYPDEGTFIVTHELPEVCAGVGQTRAGRLQTIRNAEPVVRADCADWPACPEDPAPVGFWIDPGMTVRVEAAFHDPGAGDTIQSASIDWNDGEVTPAALIHGDPSLGVHGTAIGEHSFSGCGEFNVEVRVEDDDAGVGVDRLSVTVLDPTPEITCPEDLIVTCQSPEATRVDLGMATYSQGPCFGAGLYNECEGVFGAGEEASTAALFPIGEHEVIWTAVNNQEIPIQDPEHPDDPTATIPMSRSENCVQRVTVVCPPVTVFVSSTKEGGNLGGVVGADAMCSGLAEDAGLAGTYRAWLSDTTSSPATSFVHNPAPYLLVDGTAVATDFADLTDGTLLAPIHLDENGVSRADTGRAWTGTLSTGAPSGGALCNDWASDGSSDRGAQGRAGSIVSTWSFSGAATCNRQRRLYCFEQPGFVTPVGFERIVFVSSRKRNGDLGGVAGADEICTDLASVAGLPGTFKAWLSDGTTSPLDTFAPFAGAYILVDGTVVANDFADLIDGTLMAPIRRDEYGRLVGSSSLVWTATAPTGVPMDGAKCNDWSSSSGLTRGAHGQAASTNATWSFSGASGCHKGKHLYCVQQ